MATDLTGLGTPRLGYDPDRAVKKRNSETYAKLADLQLDNAARKTNEDYIIQESMMSNIKEDGQFDREAIKLDLRTKLPHRVDEVERDWAETDLKVANANKAFDMKDPLVRAQQLKNAQDELDLLGSLIRPVMEAKEEDKEAAYQTMVTTATTKYKLDPKMFAPNYSKDEIEKLNSTTMGGIEWVKHKNEQKDKDRLNEWKTIAPSYKEKILAGVRDPVTKAAVYFDIMNDWGDVPEAVALVKGLPLKEPPQETPAGRRAEYKMAFTQRLELRKDFEKTAAQLLGPEGIDINLQKMNTTLENYKKAKPEDKDRLRRATQDVILFIFSKIEDPSSVVMPGEFERLLRNQGSLDERVISKLLNKAYGGLGELPDKSLEAMVEVANGLGDIVIERYRPNYERLKTDMVQADPDMADSELKPYAKFFESKPRNTDKPAKVTYSEYTEQKPLAIMNKAESANIPKGTWVKYKSNGKTIITKW
jgi:hypothetical protein